MEDMTKQRVEQLIDYIMKKCLWQFHSRNWDRERQNKSILEKTCEVLCGLPVKIETPEDRCYWVDAVCMADAWRIRFAWLATLDVEQIRALMKAVHERLDFLTITGSLNAELTDEHY
jgi:Fe-only nitrogenase delta subunit